MKKVVFGVLGFVGGFVGTAIVLSLLFSGVDTGGLVLLVSLAGGALAAWRSAKAVSSRAPA